jgi:hypothetical protein
MMSRRDGPEVQTGCFLYELQFEAEEKFNDKNSRVRLMSRPFRDDFKCVG